MADDPSRDRRPDPDPDLDAILERSLGHSAVDPALGPTPERGRFLTLDDVAEELATSHAQVYAMVRRRELRALKLGGRGQWRIAREDLEAFIAKAYEQTDDFIGRHPFMAGDDGAEDQVDAAGDET